MIPASSRSLVVGLAALTVLSQGCGADGDDALVTLEPLDAGDTCPAGGVRLTTGDDADGDGKLTGDEIGSTEVLCDGGAGPAAAETAVRTTPLPVGDADCPTGGVRFEAGFDNGDGGGTAGDGVLQDGEVDVSQVLCTGDDAATRSELDPPDGPVGTATITARGGTSTAACGGEGGDVFLGMFSDAGSVRPVVVHSTGTVDASLPPPVLTPRLGTNPAEVSSDTVVRLVSDSSCDGTPDDPAGLTTGALFLLECESGPDSGVWRWNGTLGERVTGIHVAAGATLTFPATSQTETYVAVSHDLHVEGTLTVAARGDNSRRLDLTGNVLLTASGSAVALSGNAARFRASFKQIHTAGRITANNTSGSGTSSVLLTSDYGTWNTGDIDVSGALDSAARGGSLDLAASSGPVVSSGTLVANGASGAGDSDGGDAGYIQLRAGTGSVFVSGELHASGGDASCGDCVGGGPAGGDGEVSILLEADRGSIHSTASLTARGGNATGGATAGSGGGIMFTTADDEGIPAGDLIITGDLDVSGGDAVNGDGGDAGDIFADLRSAGGRAQVAFLGYAGIDVSGGSSGDCDGGDGGEAWLYAGCAPVPLANGGVALSTPVTANGGASLGDDGGAGGTGGEVDLLTCWELEPGAASGSARAVVSADVSVTGGASTARKGGDGGGMFVFALDSADLRGDIDAAGGDGGEGGDAGQLQVRAPLGDATLTGNLRAPGGDGNSTEFAWGGNGGSGFLGGAHATLLGGWDVPGGSSPDDGGDGGGVELSSSMTLSTLTGAVDVSAGTGSTPGAPGTVRVDGVLR